MEYLLFGLSVSIIGLVIFLVTTLVRLNNLEHWRKHWRVEEDWTFSKTTDRTYENQSDLIELRKTNAMLLDYLKIRIIDERVNKIVKK